MVLAILAALAMVVQDVLMTLMVVAENRGRWILAGIMDTVGWLAQISTIGISVDSVVEHGLTPETWLIIGFVSVANFVGTGLGTLLGRKIKDSDAADHANDRPGISRMSRLLSFKWCRRKSHPLHAKTGEGPGLAD